MKGKYEAHRCPRCREWTTAKFYCRPCVAVLKKPGSVARRFNGLVTKWERTPGGWNATALGIVLLLLAAVVPAHGADPWSARDVALQATYTALHVMDWGQTRYIATHPERYFERNPLLGRHPHKDKVDLYFAGTLVAHTVVTHLLPKEWRPWWQCVTIAGEASVVGWNIAGGVKVRF